MTICPSCDYENLPGADACERCGNSLSDLNLPVPATPLERSLMRDRVAMLASMPPLTVASGTTIRDVLQLLNERQVGCLLVVEEGKLVGIFTERDALLKLGTAAAESGHRPVSEFMTPHPQTLGMDAKIAFALQRMDLGGFRHVPVVSRTDEPLGVISVRDILDYLTEKVTVTGPA
jgi:CBS domain-containing protein